MVNVRGVNVYPSAVESVVRRFPEVIEYRATVASGGSLRELSIDVEIAPGISAPAGVADRLAGPSQGAEIRPPAVIDRRRDGNDEQTAIAQRFRVGSNVELNPGQIGRGQLAGDVLGAPQLVDARPAGVESDHVAKRAAEREQQRRTRQREFD